MTDVQAKSDVRHSVAQCLADGRRWPLKDRLALVERLAQVVRTLHQKGRIHRAIGVDALTVDQQHRWAVMPPPALRSLGGTESDPEFCPPELVGGPALSLPAEIKAAIKVLRDAGYRFDPRRIDVYQLGTLLCRLITGEPVISYIYDARIKARVSAAVRPLLQKTLGLDSPERFESCEPLIEALNEAIRAVDDGSDTSLHETPAQGSFIVTDADTPPQGVPGVPTPSEPLPFERLGHYRLTSQLGRGGMGDVYLAYDEPLSRQVAIKVLPAQLARDTDFVRRFHAEATAAASIAHPNVVPIYFIGEDAGYHFFVMQYVDGESLGERLARDGRFRVDEALAIIGQCLAGLQAAHARGLIHRDIKPANILIDRESGRAMLVDFGLVRRLDDSSRVTATGVIMGTVDYIAPEQARGQTVDARADIYSLGVLLYQLMAGRLPFVADSPTAMIFQHAYERPFPLEKAVANVPAAVAAIVARMMAKEPVERYADCAAVTADIQAYREDRFSFPIGREAGGEGFDDAEDDPLLRPALPALPTDNGWQRARDWAATIFRRHAPEFVQDLQTTTQQADAAVAHYQRRRNRLARLLGEARSVAADLSEQIRAMKRPHLIPRHAAKVKSTSPPYVRSATFRDNRSRVSNSNSPRPMPR